MRAIKIWRAVPDSLPPTSIPQRSPAFLVDLLNAMHQPGRGCPIVSRRRLTRRRAEQGTGQLRSAAHLDRRIAAPHFFSQSGHFSMEVLHLLELSDQSTSLLALKAAQCLLHLALEIRLSPEQLALRGLQDAQQPGDELLLGTGNE